MLDDDYRRINYEDYTATCLGMIGRILGQDKWNLPPFIEMVYPDLKKRDNRTGEEIIKGVIERLS